jgi:hypothetical protein
MELVVEEEMSISSYMHSLLCFCKQLPLRLGGFHILQWMLQHSHMGLQVEEELVEVEVSIFVSMLL